MNSWILNEWINGLINDVTCKLLSKKTKKKNRIFATSLILLFLEYNNTLWYLLQFIIPELSNRWRCWVDLNLIQGWGTNSHTVRTFKMSILYGTKENKKLFHWTFFFYVCALTGVKKPVIFVHKQVCHPLALLRHQVISLKWIIPLKWFRASLNRMHLLFQLSQCQKIWQIRSNLKQQSSVEDYTLTLLEAKNQF